MKFKRFIAMLLSVVMVLGLLPMAAIAEEVGQFILVGSSGTAYGKVIIHEDEEDPNKGIPGDYTEDNPTPEPSTSPDPSASPTATPVPEEDFEIYQFTVYCWFDGALTSTKMEMVTVYDSEKTTGVSSTIQIPGIAGYQVRRCSEALVPTGGAITSVTETFTDSDITVNVIYEALDTEYYVDHVFGANTYTETFTAKVGSITQASAITGTRVIGGVTVNAEGWRAPLVVNYPVMPDKQTHIVINYTGMTYVIAFDTDGGTTANAQPVELAGATNYSIPSGKTSEKLGYTFGGWSTDGTAANKVTTVTRDALFASGGTVTLKAIWTPQNVNYTVNYWAENADDDDYSFAGSETLTAQTGSTVTRTSAQSPVNKLTGIASTDQKYFTFKSSETVTIEPDGSTIVNVYFSRKTYTFTFKAKHTHTYDGSYSVTTGSGWGRKTTTYYVGGCYPAGNASQKTGGGTSTICGLSTSGTVTIHSFTAKYGQDISGKWSFTGADGINYPRTDVVTSWTPSGSTTYTQRITRLERMPGENITFTHTTSSNSTRHFYYYVEALPGQGTSTFDGKSFILYLHLPNDFNYVYYNDDFFNLKGFTRYKITSTSGSTESHSADDSWSNKGNNFYITPETDTRWNSTT